MSESEIIKIAESKLRYGQEFVALRDTQPQETNHGEFYPKLKAKHSSFDYKPETDTLYSIGWGRFVVYEKGLWFDGNGEPQYEVY